MESYGIPFPQADKGFIPGAPPSGTLSGLDSPFQPAQSAIIGVSVRYRTYRRDTIDAMLATRKSSAGWEDPLMPSNLTFCKRDVTACGLAYARTGDDPWTNFTATTPVACVLDRH